MQALLKVIWDIALWRRGPRDLPPSRGLLVVTALLYAGASGLLSLLISGPELPVARGVADVGLTAAAFWLCLVVGRRGYRLTQTLTAVFGTGTLVALPMIAVVLLADVLGPEGPVAVALKLLLLPLQIWDLCVLAHIVRVALDGPLVTGIAVATTYYLVSYFVIERLLPATVG